MKINNVNIRTVKGQGVTEVFLTSDEPLINTVLRLPSELDLEPGTYAITFDKVESSADQPPPETDLNKMTKAELVAEAERLNVTVVPDQMSKAEIIAAIQGAV